MVKVNTTKDYKILAITVVIRNVNGSIKNETNTQKYTLMRFQNEQH